MDKSIDTSKRLTPEALADLLTRASGTQITAMDINADIERGAPADTNGMIDFHLYAAWLAREERGGRSN